MPPALSLLNSSFPKRGSTTGPRPSNSVTDAADTGEARGGVDASGADVTDVWYAVDAGTGAVLCESAGGYGE
jgi:hypothetical protein